MRVVAEVLAAGYARRRWGSASAEVPPEMMGQVEQALGVDLGRDGVVGPVGTGSSGTASDPDDRIAQLERLVALNDAGALSDAEFETEKQRLLSG